METRAIELGSVIKDIAAGPFGSNLKVSCFVDEGFPVIDGANLKGYKVTDNLTKFVTEEKARSLSRSIAHRGDVVVTISGTLGQIAYIPDDSQYEEYLCSQRQFRVTFDTTKVYVPFLVFYFHTYEGQNKILSFANQTGVPALSQPLKNFKKITVSLPELKEQKRIAGIIESLNEKIENNKKINDNLHQQAVALFRSWFVDFAPFGGTMPISWNTSSLGEVTEMGAGGDKPKITSPNKTEDCPYPIFSNGLNDYGLYGYTNEAKIHAESVTVSARGTIGFVCLRYVPYVPIVRLVTLIPKRELISAKYLYLYLRQLNISGTGTTQQQLTVPDFRKTEIVIPDRETMTSFTELITPMFEKMWVNEEENASLAKIRDTLLPKLMSGEVDVFAIQI